MTDLFCNGVLIVQICLFSQRPNYDFYVTNTHRCCSHDNSHNAGIISYFSCDNNRYKEALKTIKKIRSLESPVFYGVKLAEILIFEGWHQEQTIGRKNFLKETGPELLKFNSMYLHYFSSKEQVKTLHLCRFRYDGCEPIYRFQIDLHNNDLLNLKVVFWENMRSEYLKTQEGQQAFLKQQEFFSKKEEYYSLVKTFLAEVNGLLHE